MGYLHKGMLNAGVEQAIDALALGEISKPVTVLEGIALFKLTDRQPAVLRKFTEVRERANELWLRQRGDLNWSAFVAGLRASSDVHVDDDYLVNLPDNIY